MELDEAITSKIEDDISRLASCNDVNSQLNLLKQLNFYRISIEFRRIFLEKYYHISIELILTKLNPNWPDLRSCEVNDEFCNFFIDECHPDSWLLLNKYLQSSEFSYKLDKIVFLLESYIIKNKLADLLIESNNHDKVTTDELVCSLSSFPDRAANKLQHKNRNEFLLKNYFQSLYKSILCALNSIHKSIKNEQNASTIFISMLLGKLCLSGGLDIIMQYLIPDFLQLTETDYIWRRITQQVTSNIPNVSLEPIISCLVTKVPWYGYMERFLGDLIIRNFKLQHLMTKKFFLFKQFSQDNVIQNLIGYLAVSESRRKLLLPIFQEMLDVWGDSSAVKHTSYSQHYYITRILFCSLGFIKEFDIDCSEHKQNLIRSMMHGTQTHIQSPLPSLRTIGMLTAKHISLVLDPSGPKVDFEVDVESEHSALLSLLEVPTEPSRKKDSIIMKMEKLSIESKITVENNEDLLRKNNSDSRTDPDLDSDDDLEPFEIPKETRKELAERPVYLRDCMNGLIEQDKPDWTEKCLQYLESVIRSERDNLNENAKELSMILLHLDNHINITNFTALRRNSMVAVISLSPDKSVPYLVEQFYDRNYNIQQRLDVLESLALGAQELSNTKVNKSLETTSPNIGIHPEDQLSDWRRIVDERIKRKTRIISKGRKIPEPVPQENKFFNVANLFFYPLINYIDKKNVAFNLLEDDSFVLGRLIYTLGIIINCAANSLICRRMVSPMFDLIWSVRYHSESYVRQSLIFAFSMILVSIPGHFLLTDHQDELFECQQWLKDVLEQDVDKECSLLSRQALALVFKTIKENGQEVG